MKQVIVVNRALRLPVGKLAAQVAHAAVAAFLAAEDGPRLDWLREGMPKIVVGADDKAELLRLRDLAAERGIPAALIQDAGRTVLAPGTVTCLGLGPAPAELMDQVTGALRLL